MVERIRIDESFNRLESHFGPRFVIKPPADAEALFDLEEQTGNLPRSYKVFLLTCNGLRLRVDDMPDDVRIDGVQEAVTAIQENANPATVNGLVPVKGNSDADCDWLAAQQGPAHGAIIRWNPWASEPDFLASSFDHYLTAWSHYAVRAYDKDGRKTPFGKHTHFDRAFVARYDACPARLRMETETTEWLQALQMAKPTGADFE